MSTTLPGEPRRKSWFARHKILTSIIGVLLFFRVVGSCSGDDTETAAPPPITSTSIPVPVTTTSAPAPAETTADPAASASASAAAKKAAEKRAAEKKVAEKRAAEKKAAAAAAKKAAATKKAAAEKAAKKREAQRQAAADARAREEAALMFENCTAMNEKYPHGVGLPGATDDTSGTPVTSFTRSTKIYNLNSDSDRDGDSIACEKR